MDPSLRWDDELITSTRLTSTTCHQCNEHRHARDDVLAIVARLSGDVVLHVDLHDADAMVDATVQVAQFIDAIRFAAGDREEELRRKALCRRLRRQLVEEPAGVQSPQLDRDGVLRWVGMAESSDARAVIRATIACTATVSTLNATRLTRCDNGLVQCD
jgi:hypothetical protein